ncbi:MAG: hypothetical protein ACTHW2_12780 [Tissierella sp.]|uniref:hypothetical protein n=1 Tax=Tissierella sp. TaxID=41274 RepID=UPI003F9E43B1
MDKLRIKETLESFNLATHLPIIAISSHGTRIHSFGYDKRLHMYLKNYNIKNKFLSILKQKNSINTATIMVSKDIFFTASTICPRNSCENLFIFGPYSYDKDNVQNIIYKPRHIIKHHLSLLTNLWEDHCPRKNSVLENTAFSLHIKKAIDYISKRQTQPTF